MGEVVFKHPSKHGLKVFQKLSQMPLESLPTLDATFSTLPTPSHLVRDLFADDDVHYRSCLTGRNEGNIVDFFAGWNALADNPCADINYRIQAPYIAVGVKASKMMLAEGVRDVEGVGEWCTWGAWVPLGLVDGDGGCSYPG